MTDTERFHTWMSMKLQLIDFSIKNQTFSIDGYINVFWNWQLPKGLSKTVKSYFFHCQNSGGQEPTYNYEQINKGDNIKTFDGHFIRVLDLREKAVKFNHKLPINCRNIFKRESLMELEHTDEPTLYYNKNTGASHLQLTIKATLFEKLELFSFPFDYQYLNMRIEFNNDKFIMLPPKDEGIKFDVISEVPKGDKKPFSDIWKKMVTVTLKESLRSEIDLLSPLIYFGCPEDKRLENKGNAEDEAPNENREQLNDESKSDREEEQKDVEAQLINKQNNETVKEYVSCIRLRIVRNERYYVIRTLFPIILIVLCSFCTFLIEDKDNALIYAITVLLTYAATQTSVSSQLPDISEMSYFTYFILAGYITQALVLLWCVSRYIHIVTNNKTLMFSIIVFWSAALFFYMILWIKIRCCCCNPGFKCCTREVFAKCRRNICINTCVGKYIYELISGWHNRGDDEIQDWIDSNKESELKLADDHGYNVGADYYTSD